MAIGDKRSPTYSHAHSAGTTAAAANGAPPRRPATAAAGSPGEWIVALDPASGRFRFDFPNSDDASQSDERWLMMAFVIGLDDADFRERLVQSVFDHIVDSAASH